MLKESILFVASTGLLIYFVTPSDEPPKPETVKAELEEPSKPATQSPDNAWDYDGEDEEDEEEESYTFGEPMTGMDDAESDQDADSEVEDYGSDRNEGWSDAGSSTNSYAKTSKMTSPDSPPP
ncbi:MAG: hypothetical protein AB8B54_14345, partial [Sphingorhabdus sp.]